MSTIYSSPHSSAPIAHPQLVGTLAGRYPSHRTPVQKVGIASMRAFEESGVGGCSLHSAVSTVQLGTIVVLTFTRCRLSTSPASTFEKLLSFIQSLTRLERLRIDHFVLPNGHPNLHLPPIRIPHVYITHTHGASLSFLLNHIQPSGLTLNLCQSIQRLPDCASLCLRQIVHSDEFMDLLYHWKGLELTILDSSPFLNASSIGNLRARVLHSGEPIWPGAAVEVGGYPPEAGGLIEEFLVLVACMDHYTHQ